MQDEEPQNRNLSFLEMKTVLSRFGFVQYEKTPILIRKGIDINATIARYQSSIPAIHLLNGEISFSRRSCFSDLTETGEYLDPISILSNTIIGFASKCRDNLVRKKIEMVKSTCALYASCWTLKEPESYLMWKSYAPDKTGILATTTIRQFLDSILIPDDSYLICGPMEYLTEEIDKRNFYDALFTKYFPYKEEQEFRFYLYSRDNQRPYVYIRSEQNIVNGIWFSPLHGSINATEQAQIIMKMCGEDIQELFIGQSLIENHR